MKIKDLKSFRFEIGNTERGLDVVAVNGGIMVGNKLECGYEDDDIEDFEDLADAIDNAIWNCCSASLSEEDKNELGCYLGADYDIEKWFNENY